MKKPNSAQPKYIKKTDAPPAPATKQKSLSFYGSMLSSKIKKGAASPLTFFSKNPGPSSKQVSRKTSPVKISKKEHSTLDYSEISQNNSSIMNAGNLASALGPHNTLGGPLQTMTGATNYSNISPCRQGKKLIPDSLVKMPKLSMQIKKAGQQSVTRALDTSKYSSVTRFDTASK
jgi:hypothetical protein